MGTGKENVPSESDTDAGRDVALRVPGERLCQPVCRGLQCRFGKMAAAGLSLYGGGEQLYRSCVVVRRGNGYL